MVDLESAPQDCKDSMEQIKNILESANALAGVMSIAPYFQRVATGPVGFLWQLGNAGVAYIRTRESMRRSLDAIVRNRVRTVIDFEIIKHGGGAIADHWRTMRQAYL